MPQRRLPLVRARGALLSALLLGAILCVSPSELRAQDAPPAGSADPEIAILRIESLDAVLEEVGRIARLSGGTLSREQILGPISSGFGLESFDWVAGDRPIVAAFPASGLMLGQKGIVAAMPVSEPAAAIETLASTFDSAEAGADGVHALMRSDGTSLFVAPGNGYVSIGSTRSIVAGFEPGPVLGIVDLPRGSIAIDVFLEPVAPMAMMGLEAGREMARQGMSGGTDDGESGDSGDGSDPSESDAPNPSEAAETQDAAADVIDLYVSLFRNLLQNASRLQMSLEVGERYAITHVRVLPRAASTLSGLLEAQSGGLPPIASLVDADAPVVYAGQVTFTEAFRSALRGFADAYGNAMGDMVRASERSRDRGTAVDGFDAIFANAGAWVECMTGEMAGAMTITGDGAVQAVQVVGTTGDEACASLVEATIGSLGEAASTRGNGSGVAVDRAALDYRGVRALAYRLDPDALLAPEGDDVSEEERAELRALFGGEGMTTIAGMQAGRVLMSSGADAEAAFKALVDRAVAGRDAERAASLGASAFAPLELGAGYFGSVDVRSMLGWSKAMFEARSDAPDGSDAPELPELFEALDGLDPAESKLVYGARLETQALEFDLATPLAWLEAFADARADEGGSDAAAPGGKGRP